MNSYLIGAVDYNSVQYSVEWWYGDTLEEAVETADMMLSATNDFHWYCYPIL